MAAIAGATVTITGDHFGTSISSASVKFNGAPATIATITPTVITVTVPASATSGKISVTVNGVTYQSTSDFTVIAPPSVTGITPTAGVAGTAVTIAGANFGTAATDAIVKFNGVQATITNLTSSSITATVPTAATTGKVAVTVNGITVQSASDFTVIQPPTITSVAPQSGIVGSTVTLSGSNFGAAVTDAVVKFNGTQATVTNLTSTSITTSVPANATTGKISVTVNGVTVQSASDFTVIPPPAITSFSPSYYNVKDALPTITINGTNFSSTVADNVVKFNAVQATVLTASATVLTVKLPATATSGTITVTTFGQTATSATSFLIGCPDAKPSNLSITSITDSGGTGAFQIVAELDLENAGTIPYDIKDFYAQTYVTTDAAGKLGNAAGGNVFVTKSQLLNPGDKKHFILNWINGINLSIYSYLRVDVAPELTAPTECDATNNTAIVKLK
ncbi:MAG: IPT/TIG domain-containing protein [Bacteroidetes bacterium]|nr:IPT/TIG domain-containing protein [Bacteroidota bacterium]